MARSELQKRKSKSMELRCGHVPRMAFASGLLEVQGHKAEKDGCHHDCPTDERQRALTAILTCAGGLPRAAEAQDGRGQGTASGATTLCAPCSAMPSRWDPCSPSKVHTRLAQNKANLERRWKPRAEIVFHKAPKSQEIPQELGLPDHEWKRLCRTGAFGHA